MSESDGDQGATSTQSPAEKTGLASPSIPSATDEDIVSSLPDSSDVDTGLRVLFWKLVLLYKFALLGLTLGTLLIIFDAGPDIGPAIVAGSVILLAYTMYATKRGKDRVDAGEFHQPDRRQRIHQTDEIAGGESTADDGTVPDDGPGPQEGESSSGSNSQAGSDRP